MKNTRYKLTTKAKEQHQPITFLSYFKFYHKQALAQTYCTNIRIIWCGCSCCTVWPYFFSYFLVILIYTTMYYVTVKGFLKIDKFGIDLFYLFLSMYSFTCFSSKYLIKYLINLLPFVDWRRWLTICK